jgi:hypothetical protein
MAGVFRNPFRVYAQRTGPALAVEWARKLAAPEVFRLHVLDVFLPDMPPPAVSVSPEASDAHAFPDSGFAALHTGLADPDNDTALLLRASRYGAVSHQHADQGSFALVHGRTTLITPSGYFGAGWGTRHHFEWMRTTQAHNCVLIDGQPQPFAFTSTARILTCGMDGAVRHASADLTEAYPMLTSYTRYYTLEKRGGLTVAVVRDELAADKPVTVSYLNHTLSPPECRPDGTVIVKRNGVTLEIKPRKGLKPGVSYTDQFAVDVNEGTPPGYVSWAMPAQHHLRWESEAACRHEIIVEYTVTI